VGVYARPAVEDPDRTTPPPSPSAGRRVDRGLDDLLRSTVRETARLLDADGAFLYLWDPETRQLRFTHAAGIGEVAADHWMRELVLPEGVGLFGKAVAERRVVTTGSYPADTSFVHMEDSDRFVGEVGIQSLVVAPMVADDEVFGALGTFSRLDDAFTAPQIALVRALADHAALAMANALLIDTLARRADEERTLREIARRLMTIQDPAELLQDVVDQAARLLGSLGAVIDLLDPATGTVRWAYDAGVDDVTRAEWQRRSAAVDGVYLAIRERRVIVTDHYAEDDRFADAAASRDFLERVGVRSIAFAPLGGDAAVLGALSVHAPEAGRFGEPEAALLGALADLATIAIRNAELIADLATSREETARRAETERTLREIAARITAIRDQDTILGLIVDETRRVLESDGAHLTRLAEDGSCLRPVVITGGMTDETRDWLRTQQFPIDGGINGLAAGQGTVVWTPDYTTDPRIPRDQDDLEVAERMGLRAMAAAPLRAPGGEVMGTLAVSYRSPRPFDADRLATLQALADHAAIALANTDLLARLASSEANYRGLVQTTPDVIWRNDAEGRFTFMAEGAETLFGWRPDELVGRHFSFLVTPESMPDAAAAWDRLHASPDTVWRLPFVLRRADGSTFRSETSAVPSFEDGEFAGAQGTVRDVSEQARLERELRDSEERYRYLVQASPDLVWMTDAEGRFTFVSDQAEAIIGWQPHELLGREFADITPPAERRAALIAFRTVRRRPTRVQRRRMNVITRDGRELAMEITAIGMLEDGRFAGTHGAARDIGERDRLERNLRRQAAELAASEERAHLARELHDSVTQALFSMTLLSRSIELLLDRDPAQVPGKLTALRELQRDALAEMRALIFELRPGNIEESGLVTALRTHAAALSGRIGLAIVVEADLPERPPIEVEETLYRIAQEALHNVVKHAGARQVRIEVDQVPDGVRMVVVDDGRGFDPASVPDGHLGLAGIHARAERLGGHVLVTSARDQGTTVEVIAPVRDQREH
jgi:PAS domain S-box-containing protein